MSLQQLTEALQRQSVLTEKEMIEHVLYPFFCATYKHPPDAALSVGPCGEVPRRAPYLLRIVVEYVRSLLELQILPHKVLQCFVFDLCVRFGQDHMLQQLLHYHVLLDSPEVCARLQQRMHDEPTGAEHWAAQQALDMAQRLGDHASVVALLCATCRLLDVLPYLRQARVCDLPLTPLFKAVEHDDAKSHVHAELRAWVRDAHLSGGVLRPPCLTGLQQWFPDLVEG